MAGPQEMRQQLMGMVSSLSTQVGTLSADLPNLRTENANVNAKLDHLHHDQMAKEVEIRELKNANTKLLAMSGGEGKGLGTLVNVKTMAP